MRSGYGYTIVRWVLAISLLVMAAFYLNHAVSSAWQIAAPADFERPAVWTYQAYRSFGRCLAVGFMAVLVVLNVRPGWPNLRSTWNLFWVAAALVALLAPPAWRFMAIDGCLDSGGLWDYEYEECRK